MSFKQIIGQDRAVNVLKSALLKNRLAHAYLFEGPPGVGKAFTALNFIKAINCLNAAGAADNCGECESCRKIDAKNHIDAGWLNVLKGKQQIAIEQVWQMQGQINLRPYEAKFKAFCIPDADFMSQEAQGALLKTLEEPPVKSIIILTTSNMPGLLDTIVSRCQLVKFLPLNIKCAGQILEKRFNVGPDAAYFLAYIAQSGIADVSLHAQPGVLENKNRIINEFNDFLKKPFAELSFLKEGDEQIQWALTVLLWWYRDLLILKETAAPAMLANKDRAEDLKRAAAGHSASCLGAIIGAILKTSQLIYQTNVNPKLALPVMLADILSEVKYVSGGAG